MPDGAYGVTVNTEVCGTFDLGSIPSRHPKTKAPKGLLFVINMFNTTKAQRKKIKRAFREKNVSYVLKFIIFHLRLSRFFILKRLGYKMYVAYTPFSFWLWTEGRVRSDEEFYIKYLREGDVVIDAGANIGVCTLLSSNILGNKGKVFSFEPLKKTYHYLKRNVKISKHQNIKIFNIVLSDKKENIGFTDHYVSDINHVDKNQKTKVELIDLDSTLAKEKIEKINLFKIDVEGYELFALKGAVNTIKKTDLIYFESAERSFNRFGYSAGEIIIFLEGEGFDVYKYKNSFLEKIDRNYTTISGYENLLAFKNEDKDKILQRISL